MISQQSVARPQGCGGFKSRQQEGHGLSSVGSHVPAQREVPGSAACSSLELLEDDLELVLCLYHVQQKGHVVAVVLDDVVVHVHQDPTEEKNGWIRCSTLKAVPSLRGSTINKTIN